MKLPRRKFLHLAAGAATLPAVSRIAWAQAYPTRPMRILVAMPLAAHSTSVRGSSRSGCRNGSASNLSSRTGRARQAISQPKR